MEHIIQPGRVVNFMEKFCEDVKCVQAWPPKFQGRLVDDVEISARNGQKRLLRKGEELVILAMNR